MREYGIEIVGEIRRLIENFCNTKIIKTKRINDEESYCERLSFDDLYLIIVFKSTNDSRKIITLFPTNKKSTIKRFCP